MNSQERQICVHMLVDMNTNICNYTSLKRSSRRQIVFPILNLCILCMKILVYLTQIMMKILHQSSELKLSTYVFVLIFGTGSWIAVNGVWVELPNLVNVTPEGWKLASYFTLICQLANVGPIVYGLITRKRDNEKNFEKKTIYFILILGSTTCVLLSVFWKKTAIIFGRERSVALLGLVFILALVDCTSSVTFLPFLASLPPSYMSPFYIGETLSGFFPSLVALAQGVIVTQKINSTEYNNTIQINKTSGLRFSQSIFFIVLALMMVSAFLSFVMLTSFTSLNEGDSLLNKSEQHDDPTGVPENIKTESSFPIKVIYILLVMMVWLNFLQNGVLSGISSYASGPYGSFTYHLTATLGSISSALASFIYLWFPNKSFRKVSLLIVLYTIVSCYIIGMAVMSPDPLLKNDVSGKFLIILFSVTASSLVAYSKLSIASIMRDEGRKYLFYAGIAVQLGSFIGAVLTFFIVNYAGVFHSS